MTNDGSIGSMKIDCTEFVSKSMAKKAATTRAKISIQRPNSLIKQSRLKSLLAKDFLE